MKTKRTGYPERGLAKLREPRRTPLEFERVPPEWLDDIGDMFHGYCDEIGASVACRIGILAYEIGCTLATRGTDSLTVEAVNELLDSVRVVAHEVFKEYREHGAGDTMVN